MSTTVASFLQMEAGRLESQVLVFRGSHLRACMVPGHLCLPSSLPIMTIFQSPLWGRETSRGWLWHPGKWENDSFLFSVFRVPCPTLRQAHNSPECHEDPQLLWPSWLPGAHLPYFRRGLRAELGPFIVFTLGLLWPLRKNLLEADTSACGNVCIIITILFNKVSDVS